MKRLVPLFFEFCLWREDAKCVVKNLLAGKDQRVQNQFLTRFLFAFHNIKANILNIHERICTEHYVYQRSYYSNSLIDVNANGFMLETELIIY